MSLAAMKPRLVLIGAGRMGGAMLSGWLAQGVDAARVCILDPHAPDAIKALATQKNIALNPDLNDVEPSDVVVLAVKPQMMDEVLASHSGLIGKDTLVLSIAAGCTLAQLARPLIDQAAIVRAMPNTPAAIGKGVTAYFGNPHCSDKQMELAAALLAAVGQVVALDDESQMDAVTAVSGSGPAYVFHMVEAMAAAGEAAGLSPAMAQQLARATVIGAGGLLDESPDSASTLRENVTSPGGTTAAALSVLMDGQGLTALMTRAIDQAAKRSRELAG